MKSRHYFDAEIILKLASYFRNTDFRVQQIMQGRVAKDDDHLRPNHCHLSQQKRPARVRLLNGRLTIAGRTATVDIADKNFFAFKSDAFDYLG